MVTDAATTGERLPGVTVLLKGTTQGVSTDTAGAFVLPLPAEAQTVQLVFSFVGYAHQEQIVAAHGSAPLAVALAADTRLMGEVIIVGGYQTGRPWPWHPRPPLPLDEIPAGAAVSALVPNFSPPKTLVPGYDATTPGPTADAAFFGLLHF